MAAATSRYLFPPISKITRPLRRISALPKVRLTSALAVRIEPRRDPLLPSPTLVGEGSNGAVANAPLAGRRFGPILQRRDRGGRWRARDRGGSGPSPAPSQTTLPGIGGGRPSSC